MVSTDSTPTPMANTLGHGPFNLVMHLIGPGTSFATILLARCSSLLLSSSAGSGPHQLLQFYGGLLG